MKGLGFEIKEMFAFVAVHGDGDEGVLGASINSQWMPLVGADLDRVKSLAPIAKHIAEETGTAIKLVKFSNREELDIDSLVDADDL